MRTDDLEARLLRRHRRFGVYLKVRGVIGLLLVAAAAGLGVVAAGVAFGAAWVRDLSFLPGWAADGGFGAAMTTLILLTLVFFAGRAGIAYWRHRHLEDDDTGCLAG